MLKRKKEVSVITKPLKHFLILTAVHTILIGGVVIGIRSCKSIDTLKRSGYQYDSTERVNITSIGDTGQGKISPVGVDTVYLTKKSHTTDTFRLPANIDTAAIISAYLNHAYFYSQTLRDSDMVIQIEDTIYRNTPVYRKVTAKNLRATRFDTTVNLPASRHFFAGGEVSSLARLNLGLAYQNKKGQIFTLTSSINSPQPNVNIGVYLKIK